MIVADFYKDCEVFVTGGSGVVGKALLEKLLRSCHVKKIYVLLRSKKGLNAEQRLQQIIKAEIFRRIIKYQPDELDKLAAIPGDATLPNLGITEEYAKILENVSVIFHCAATVRFDEPLKVALQLNVGGTFEALKFAETLKNLKIFLHVSTYFSNPYLKHVEPKIYEAPMDWKFCLDLVKNGFDEDTLDTLTRKLITGFPNTYTFTKNLSESMVSSFHERLPVAIYRPSIVLFALHEPEPGFPPSLYGAMGIFVLVGAGILKCVYIDDYTRLDITPQDLGINVMIYYGARAGSEYKKGIPSEAPVYMFSSYKSSPYTFKEMALVAESGNQWVQYAFEKNFMIPGCRYTSSRFIYMFYVFFKQILPALLADLIIMATGRKPVIMSIVRRGYVTLEIMQPFMFNNITSPGITHIEELEEDCKGSDFDISHVLHSVTGIDGLRKFIRIMLPKIREILLNEDPKTLPKYRKILKIKIVVYNIIRLILGYYFLRWLYFKLSNCVSEYF